MTDSEAGRDGGSAEERTAETSAAAGPSRQSESADPRRAVPDGGRSEEEENEWNDPPGLDMDEAPATEETEDVGDNVFGGPLERGPIEPGRPDAENVLFVLLGILAGVLVIMRLVGAI